MRAEENRRGDNVIAFHRPAPELQTEGDRREAHDAAGELTVPAPMVLNADRGIINTGTVHGGQHVTAIEVSGHSDRGADVDI
ncbi:S-type pyocin domain-containing protein [Streptomyces sp. NPDC050516]|uniref:S-type pyocin domain-containing protein n=1 Tax=Streptomyces sp. NPDC050516 TaxID=3365621 RepID=UPI00379B4D65